MWILSEPTELRSIIDQNWYADGTFYPMIAHKFPSSQVIESLKTIKITPPVAFVLMLKEVRNII